MSLNWLSYYAIREYDIVEIEMFAGLYIIFWNEQRFILCSLIFSLKVKHDKHPYWTYFNMFWYAWNKYCSTVDKSGGISIWCAPLEWYLSNLSCCCLFYNHITVLVFSHSFIISLSLAVWTQSLPSLPALYLISDKVRAEGQTWPET